MKHIALLRGINVGGNNRVVMTDLKKCFESLGLNKVVTYINSGNVIFDTQELDKTKLVSMSEEAIEKQFGFKIVCSVISAYELRDALSKVPKWWSKDNESSHNALFAIAPKTAHEVMDQLGQIESEYEKVFVAEPLIFWSAPRNTIERTRYSKIAGMKVYKNITIRNANTTKKLLELST